MAELSFTEFKFEQLTFEIRYPDAFRLWDRAGVIWTNVQQTFGNLSAKEVVPNSQVFQAERRYALNVSTTTSFVIDHAPSANTKAPVFIGIVAKHLELKSLTRVGVRVQYARPVKDAQEGYTIFQKLGLVTAPRQKLFDVAPQTVNPFYQVEIIDGDFGYTIRAATRKQGIEFNPPPELVRDLDAQSFEKHHLLLDLDMYTMNAISTELFEPESWLKKWTKLAEADLPKFLEMAK